jgi:hypothetical protein
MIGKADVVSEMPEIKPKGPKRALNAGLAAYLEKKKKMKADKAQEGDGFGSFLGAVAKPLAGLVIREGGKYASDQLAKKVEGSAIKKGKKKGMKNISGGTFKLRTG